MNMIEEYSDKNYYELLGVSRNASRQEIKQAYKELALIFHPDSNYYSDFAELGLSTGDIQVFKMITCAYNILSNDDRRADYDMELAPELPDWELDRDNNWEEPGQYLRFVEKQRAAQESVFGTPYDDPSVLEPDAPSSMSNLIAVQHKQSLKELLLIASGVLLMIASICVIIAYV